MGFTGKCSLSQPTALYLVHFFPLPQVMYTSNSRKYPCLPHGRDFFLRPSTLWKFQLSFLHFFKFFGLTELPTPQEIPIPSVGGVWVFSGTAQLVDMQATCLFSLWMSPEKLELFKNWLDQQHLSLVVRRRRTTSSCKKATIPSITAICRVSRDSIPSYNGTLYLFLKMAKIIDTLVPQGGRVLGISSDGDDRRIFLGLNFRFRDFLGYENLTSIFLG